MLKPREKSFLFLASRYCLQHELRPLPVLFKKKANKVESL
jgi:hypothetical protein